MKFCHVRSTLFVVCVLQHVLAQSVLEQLTTVKCGGGIGCFFHPPDCDPARHECVYASTFQKYDNETVEITLAGTSETALSDNNVKYIALGLSDDPKMGNDSVVACVSKAEVFLFYNPAQSSIPVSLSSPNINNLSFVKPHSGEFSDNTFWCRFRQKIVPQVDNGQIFDLSREFYLLLATGNVIPIPPFALGQHVMDPTGKYFPVVSSTKASLVSGTANFRTAPAAPPTPTAEPEPVQTEVTNSGQLQTSSSSVGVRCKTGTVIKDVGSQGASYCISNNWCSISNERGSEKAIPSCDFPSCDKEGCFERNDKVLKFCCCATSDNCANNYESQIFDRSPDENNGTLKMLPSSVYRTVFVLLLFILNAL